MASKTREQKTYNRAVHTGRLREAKQRATHSALEWRDVLRRYDYRCAYCGERELLTVDHVISVAEGGSDAIDNVVPACLSCNVRKNNTGGGWVPNPPRYSESPPDWPVSTDTLAYRLKESRARASMSVESLAAAANMSVVTIRAYEREIRMPARWALRSMAAALKVDPDWLLRGEGE